MRKSKKLSSRLIALTMTLCVAFTTMAQAVSAATTTDKTLKFTDWGYDFQGSGLPNAYDPQTGNSDNNQFKYQWANDFYYFQTASGNYAYCVQLGSHSYDGTTMNAIELDDTAAKKYYSNDTQRRILRDSTMYTYKGTSKYGYSKAVEVVASQAMVWAISGKFFDSSTTALSTNETKLLNSIKAPSSTSRSQLVDCYKKMKTDILSHRTLASGMLPDKNTALNAPKTLKYNSTSNRWECTVASNSYLSQFSLPTVSGVTFTRSGNNLKVSATTTGVKNLEKAGALKFTKTKAVYATKIEDCTPLYLSSTKSQDKVSYDLKGGDPVEGYMAFEGAFGNVTITKTAKDAGGKTYTATSSANSTLNSAVTFKIKASNGNWVNATHDSSGKYTFTRSDSTATGQNFKLDSNGKFTVSGLPAGTYTLTETATASGYKKSADVTFTVSDDNTTSTSVVNTQNTGNVTITKTAKDADGKTYTATSTANSSLNSAVTFKIKASNGNWVNATHDGSGKYTFTRADSTATGQNFKLDKNGKFNISGLPTGTYTLMETTTASGYTKSADVKFTVSADNTTSTSVVNTQNNSSRQNLLHDAVNN